MQVSSRFEGAINNITVAGSVAVGTVAVAVGGSVSINRVKAATRQASAMPARSNRARPAARWRAWRCRRATTAMLAVAGGRVAVSPGSGAGIAAGVAATDNRIGNQTLAYIDGTSETNAGSTTPHADRHCGRCGQHSRIVSVSIGVAAAVAAGRGFAGAGPAPAAATPSAARA